MLPVCSEIRSEKSVKPLLRCTEVGTEVTHVRADLIKLPS